MGEMERETIDRTYIVYAPPYQNPIPKGNPHLWNSAHESVWQWYINSERLS